MALILSGTRAQTQNIPKIECEKNLQSSASADEFWDCTTALAIITVLPRLERPPRLVRPPE